MNPGDPFPCPNCGESNWKADYYQAVSQGLVLVIGDDGEREYGDYAGDEETYDDGSTEDEALHCRECGHTIPLGVFRMIDEEDLAKLRELVPRLDALAKGLRDGGPLMQAVSTVLEASAAVSKLTGQPVST